MFNNLFIGNNYSPAYIWHVLALEHFLRKPNNINLRTFVTYAYTFPILAPEILLNFVPY
jgi:hypothetical protein